MEMGHTSEMAHQAMIEELEKLFEGKEYSGQEGPKPLKIFKQFEPIPTDNDEDTDTNAANCPCIICKLLSGNFAASGEAQLLMFQLVIAAYDRDVSRQGYTDVVNIKEAITQHFWQSRRLAALLSCSIRWPGQSRRKALCPTTGAS